MAFVWVSCVGVVMILFGYRLWFVPVTFQMPAWSTSLLSMAGIFGSISFAIMSFTWLTSLIKKDHFGYKPVYGLKTSWLLSSGVVMLLFTFVELQGMSNKLKSTEASARVLLPQPLSDTTLSRNTPIPTPAPVTTKKTQMVVTQVDCIGPDKVVFKTTKEECLRFNQSWGVTPVIHSPPPAVKVATPTSQCVLSFGTYNLTATDCAKFKQQDQSLREWNNSLQILKDYQGSTAGTGESYDSGDTSDYVYVDYSQQNTACKADVQDWLNDEIRSIEAVGRANGSGSEVEYKISQAQSQANSEVAECDRLYPVQ